MSLDGACSVSDRQLSDSLERVGCCVCLAQGSSGGPGCGEFDFSEPVAYRSTAFGEGSDGVVIEGLAEALVQGFRCPKEPSRRG